MQDQPIQSEIPKQKFNFRPLLIIFNIILFLLNIFAIYTLILINETTIKKPILYLYPTTTEKIQIKLEKDNLIKTSYPKYNKGWEVIASPDGNLQINNKNYYGLYWDEKNMQKTNFKTGFYVEKEEALNFLEEKLAIIGLNEREANEFIIYWLPVLERNEKSLIYFELTEEREQHNKLNINPKPDSLLRIVIHIKRVNKKTTIKEEYLPTFERKGFVAVEWGGINYG